MTKDDNEATTNSRDTGPTQRTTLTLPKKSRIELSDVDKNTIRLRASFADWISSASAGFDYAATLTYPPELAPRSRTDAERIAKRFVERYNIESGYGTNAMWNAKLEPAKAAAIFMVNDSTCEDGKEANFHHHLALVKPVDISDEDFVAVVDWCWQQALPLGRSGRTEIEQIKNAGWSAYLASKQHIGDQARFDVHNSNIY